MHRAPWPIAEPLRTAADPAVVAAAGSALAALRKVKSEAKVSMRTRDHRGRPRRARRAATGVESALGDIRAAGRVTGTLTLVDGDGETCVARDAVLVPPGTEGLTCASSGRTPWSSSTRPRASPGCSPTGSRGTPRGRSPSGGRRHVDAGDRRGVRRRGHRRRQGARRARHRAGRPRRDHVPHALRVDPARLRVLGGGRPRRARLRDVVGRAGPLDRWPTPGSGSPSSRPRSTPRSSRRSATTCPGCATCS